MEDLPACGRVEPALMLSVLRPLGEFRRDIEHPKQVLGWEPRGRAEDYDLDDLGGWHQTRPTTAIHPLSFLFDLIWIDLGPARELHYGLDKFFGREVALFEIPPPFLEPRSPEPLPSDRLQSTFNTLIVVDSDEGEHLVISQAHKLFNERLGPELFQL